MTVTPDIIDLHSHWFSPTSVALLSARSFGARIERLPDGALALHRPTAGVARAPFVLGAQWFDNDARIAHLDAVGVRHQLISWPTTLGVDPALDAEDAKPIWRAYNDELAQVVDARRARLSGLAALSTADIPWSRDEFVRASDDLGLIGAVLPVNGFASLAGARTFAPIFEEAQRRKSHIYLHTGYAHPSVPGQPAVVLHADSEGARGALDTAWHFAAAVITLAFTDFLDAYPDVTVQVAMLGGSGAIALIAEQIAEAPQRFGGAPPRWNRILLDTGAAGKGPQAIALAANVLGADRVVFGSDYAPAPSIAPVIANVNAAPIDPQARQRILVDNGLALLRAKGVDLPDAPILSQRSVA